MQGIEAIIAQAVISWSLSKMPLHIKGCISRADEQNSHKFEVLHQLFHIPGK
jgi:hypothetical protein